VLPDLIGRAVPRRQNRRSGYLPDRAACCGTCSGTASQDSLGYPDKAESGLYLNPPQYPAIFCVDQKTAIQALDRLDRVLPLSRGRTERHGFEYYQHGTLSVYAPLDHRNWPRSWQNHPQATPADLSSFYKKSSLSLSLSLCPRQRIHIILDSLSAHKTALVRAFLETPPPRTVPFQSRILFLVRRNRTRGYRSRSLHFGSRFRPQAALRVNWR
jgi:hypothetical protein